MKKVLALIMTFVLSLSCFCAAFAAQPEEMTPYASTYFSNCTTGIVALGDGDLRISARVETKNEMLELGITKIVIYDSDDTKLKTYTSTSNPSFIGTNNDIHSTSVTYSGIEGESYYAKITFYAEDANGTASKTITTSTRTA